MGKFRSGEKIKLQSYDELMGINESTSGQIVLKSDIQEICLDRLHEFEGHPFRVLDNEKMYELVQSIKERGVLVPGIARVRADGEYEIVAGHRRHRACELAGRETMPMHIMELTDDEATVIMVESNFQRDDLLPSEKAKAYKMRFDAMKHQGRAGGRTIEALGNDSGDNAKTVQRYIRLSMLNSELLEMVDENKLGFSQGIDISFLSKKEQEWVLDTVKQTGVRVSMNQSAVLKELSKQKVLTLADVEDTLGAEKTAKRAINLTSRKLNKYFAAEYTIEEIESIIFGLLEDWKKKQ